MLTVEVLKEFGADTNQGLERCMNNQAFYLKMVNMGLSDKRFEMLGDALQKGDIDEAFEHAHALKGVLGNLAITPLYDRINGMTERLRAKEQADYLPDYREFMDLRGKLLSL